MVDFYTGFIRNTTARMQLAMDTFRIRSDHVLRKNVDSELAEDPTINSDNIEIEVADGVVMVTGHVGSLIEKLAVERAVQRVGGLCGIALDLEVLLKPSDQRSDADIAMSARATLAANLRIPRGCVAIEVEHGYISLSGIVRWRYQSAIAEQSMYCLVGVRGITNDIDIESPIGRGSGATDSQQAAA